MNNLNILTLFSLVLLFACESDTFEREQLDFDLINTLNRESPTGDLSYFRLAESTDLDNLPQDPRNPLTAIKVELGSFLFFETGMGTVPVNPTGLKSYSCGSCHVPSADFKPGRRQGIGEGGIGFGFRGESRVKHSAYDEGQMDVQGIRPLNVLNVAYSAENTLWNGSFGSGAANADVSDIWGVFDPPTDLNFLGYQGLETQNIEGLNVHRMLMTREVADALGYTSYFDAAFPELSEEERYSNLAVSLALSAYLRTITTTEAPFQKWLNGSMDAMSAQEKRGALVFFNEGNCNTCHTSPAFSAVKFFALGVNDLDDHVSFKKGPELAKKNLGRGGFTGREADMFKFKVPTLYNLQGTPFYFHGASKQSLEEVVDYFDKAVPENPDVPASQLAYEFKPLGLSDQQKTDLVAFLKFGLQDANVTRHAPSALPSGNCFPNADPLSKREIGCE